MKTEYFASKKPQSNERLLLVTRLHYLLSINACMCQRYSCYLEIPNKLFCIGCDGSRMPKTVHGRFNYVFLQGVTTPDA